MVMSEMLNNFNCIVDKNYQSLETIKRQYGIVKELIANTDSAKVIVKIRNIEDDNDDKTKMITLLNKTGQRLKVDDRVWVYYWRTITDGCVAIKIGKQRKKKDKLRISIDRAMVVTNDEDTLENITENELHYFQVANLIQTQSGAMPNVPFVNGYPVAYWAITDSDYQSLPVTINNDTAGYSDYKNFILGLSSSYFVKRLVVVSSPVINEYKIGIYRVQRYDDKWYYQPALYVRTKSENDAWSDWQLYDTPSENLYVSSPNDLANGEIAMIYNHANFAESYSANQQRHYGAFSGVLVFRLLGAGVNPVNHTSGIDIHFTRIPKDSFGHNFYLGFGFASRVEKDYIRQLQSKTESYPY